MTRELVYVRDGDGAYFTMHQVTDCEEWDPDKTYHSSLVWPNDPEAGGYVKTCTMTCTVWTPQIQHTQLITCDWTDGSDLGLPLRGEKSCSAID